MCFLLFVDLQQTYLFVKGFFCFCLTNPGSIAHTALIQNFFLSFFSLCLSTFIMMRLIFQTHLLRLCFKSKTKQPSVKIHLQFSKLKIAQRTLPKNRPFRAFWIQTALLQQNHKVNMLKELQILNHALNKKILKPVLVSVQCVMLAQLFWCVLGQL